MGIDKVKDNSFLGFLAIALISLAGMLLFAEIAEAWCAASSAPVIPGQMTRCGGCAGATIECGTQCCQGSEKCCLAGCKASCSDIPKKPNGQACTKNSDCTSGFCVDKICCNSACTGNCSLCNIAGSVGTCKTYPTYNCVPGNNIQISWSCSGSSCCAAQSCIDKSGKCRENNKLGSGLNSGGNDDDAACSSGVWVDCDANNNYAGLCKSACGAGAGVYAGEAGVGEYSNTNSLGCCGDDANEVYKSGEAVLAGGSPRCCSNANDCVDSGSVCREQGSFAGDKKCFGGRWDYPKLTWDGTKENTCSRKEQCLVDPKGNRVLDDQPELWYVAGTRANASNATTYYPKCISNNQFILDHACYDGRWTSRTAYVAGMMIREANEAGLNYVVFCDDYQRSLNYYQYVLSANISVESYLKSPGDCGGYPCFNNFCVLLDEAGSRVVAVGGSMNPGTDGGFNLNRLGNIFNLNSTLCPKNANRDYFDSCGFTGLRYNAYRKMFIYVNPEFLGQFETVDFVQRLISWIKQPFESILSLFLNTSLKDTEAGIYNLNEMADFSRLYLARKCDKYIYGLQDKINATDRMFIEYNGFTTDFCDEVKVRITSEGGNCSIAGDSQYLFARKKGNESNLLFDSWLELTAKLRLQCDTEVAESTE